MRSIQRTQCHRKSNLHSRGPGEGVGWQDLIWLCSNSTAALAGVQQLQSGRLLWGVGRSHLSRCSFCLQSVREMQQVRAE